MNDMYNVTLRKPDGDIHLNSFTDFVAASQFAMDYLNKFPQPEVNSIIVSRVVIVTTEEPVLTFGG